MVRKFHIHIYRVVEEMEVDTLASNGIIAKGMALDAAKQGILKKSKPDCNLIAIEFEVVEKKEE